MKAGGRAGGKAEWKAAERSGVMEGGSPGRSSPGRTGRRGPPEDPGVALLESKNKKG